MVTVSEMKADFTKITPQCVAQYFKYCMQFNNPAIIIKQDFHRVFSKSFYYKYKSQFDVLVKLFSKHKLNAIDYIDFFINEYHKNINDIKTLLVSSQAIHAYMNSIEIKRQKQKIFTWIQKSIDNIVNDCIEQNCHSVKDYVIDLIRTHKIANYYLTGRISKYWFSAIPNFKKIIKRLDSISQDEFRDIYDKCDIYCKDANDAYYMANHHHLNPIKAADECLRSRQSFIKSK